MTDVSHLKPIDTPSRRRVLEDEEEIIRRLSAEAKLRIYEEVKELLDAKAARDALRPAPTTHSAGSGRGRLGIAKEMPAEPNLPRKPAKPKAIDDSSGDLIIFSEGGSYQMEPGDADLDSELESSGLPSARPREKSPKPKDEKPGRKGGRAPAASKAAAPAAGGSKTPSKRFTLLTGLGEDQVKLLRNAGTRQKFEEGETVFASGDQADGVFIILRGRVEVTTEIAGLEHSSTRRSGEWFGELELMTSAAHRRATAKAVRPTSLFEISGNPIELFRWLPDQKAAMRLLRNSVCLMSRHLREMAEESARMPSKPKDALGDSSPTPNWEVAKKFLPPGLMSRIENCRSFEETRLLDGQHLYREGDAPDGIYFIQAGTLDVFRKSGRRQRKLSTLEGPMVIGDVSFFSHHDRSVSVRAFGPVRLLKFSGERFKRVKKRDPEETLDLLLLCAEFAAGLQRVRQGAAPRT